MSNQPTNAEQPDPQQSRPEAAAPQPPYAPYQPPAPTQQPYAPQQPYGTPQYPDPTAPAAYPGATAHGNVPPQYPGYAGPSAYRPGPLPTTGPGGLAITALIVGIAAFLLQWIPILGAIIAVAGIVLGILALRQPRGKGFGIAAIVLSGLAAVFGILMFLLIFMWPPMAAG